MLGLTDVLFAMPVQKGMCPLLSAAAAGHVDCIKLLVGHKCDINATNPVRLSLLFTQTYTYIGIQIYYAQMYYNDVKVVFRQPHLRLRHDIFRMTVNYRVGCTLGLKLHWLWMTLEWFAWKTCFFQKSSRTVYSVFTHISGLTSRIFGPHFAIGLDFMLWTNVLHRQFAGKATMTYILLKASARAPSGPHFLLNGLLIFGIICLVTLLIFPHSLHSSVQLNVLISTIFLTSNNCPAIQFYKSILFLTLVFLFPTRGC